MTFLAQLLELNQLRNNNNNKNYKTFFFISYDQVQ
jgi:hypothetical protein